MSGQLLIFITFHSCFLSIIFGRLSYSANDLAIETATYTYICIYSIPYQYTYFQLSMFPLLIISSGSPRLCEYSASGCVQKKFTQYRNFFRNLNFKNIVIFLKGHVAQIFERCTGSFLAHSLLLKKNLKLCHLMFILTFMHSFKMLLYY